MEIIQTSDLHIGECRNLDANYLERHTSILHQIMDIAYNNGCPLLISGDLFHLKSTTYNERIIVFKWLLELEKRKIPTVIISGNHDHILGEITQLDELQYVPYEYVKVVSWHPKVHKIGNMGVICIPWQNYNTETLEKTVRLYLPSVLDCDYRVVMMHEMLTGSIANSGMVLSSKLAIPSISEITYWCVGDIHKFQKTNVANGYYAGSPAQYRFDDTIPKGVLKIDLDHPSLKPEMIPISVKQLQTVSSVNEIIDDCYYRVVGGYADVLQAAKDERVVKIEYSEEQEKTITYEKVGIVDGLAEILAEKGFESDIQQKGVSWVKKLLNEG